MSIFFLLVPNFMYMKKIIEIILQFAFEESEFIFARIDVCLFLKFLSEILAEKKSALFVLNNLKDRLFKWVRGYPRYP